MGRGNQYIQLVKVMCCKLPTIGKKSQSFPTWGSGFETPTSEVGGECVTTAPPWPQISDISDKYIHICTENFTITQS